MMRTPHALRLFALALFGVGLTSTALAQPSGPILPGHWEYSYKIGGFLPVGSEEKCLTEKDVAQFAAGICTRRYKCAYDRKIVQDGKIDLKGVWTDKKNRKAPVTATGVYGPESFQLDVKLKTVNGLPLAGVMN